MRGVRPPPKMASTSFPADKQRTLLACCRPDGDDCGDKKIRAALAHLNGDAALQESFNQQAEFDRPLAALVRAVPLPENFDQEIDAGLNRASTLQFSWRGLFRQPAFWAVLLAFAFLVAWGANAFYQRAIGFPGDENVTRLIEGLMAADTAPAHGTATRFEPVSIESGKLGDTLFLAHNVEAFHVPAPFATTWTVSYRVVERNDAAITQVNVKERDMTFLIFRAPDLGVNIKPAGRWKFLEGEGWAAAAQVKDHVCFVAVFPGTKADVQAYIEQGGEPAGH